MLASPRGSQSLLAEAIDAPVPRRAVQVAAAARGGRGRHALSVVAGFRVDAVAVLVTARHRAPLLADADLADFPSLAVFMAGALHGAMAVPALVRVQALRLPVGPRLRPVALAIAEGVELAGAPGARGGPAVRGRRAHLPVPLLRRLRGRRDAAGARRAAAMLALVQVPGRPLHRAVRRP